MNFSTIQFTAVMRNTCRGCIAEHERMTVCKVLNERAAAHGLPDCDGAPDAQGHIFLVSDGELFGMVQQSGQATAVTVASPVTNKTN